MNTNSSLVIRPTQPTIGAEIEGLDLTEPLSDQDRDAIKGALLKYKVIFFRNQFLNSHQHAAFGAQFGPLYVHPSTERHEELSVVQIIKPPDRERLAKRKAAMLPDQVSDGFHADASWRLVPIRAAVLRAVNIPSVGGDTIWVDAGLAYDSFPEATKRRLEGLHVTHDFRQSLQAVNLHYPIVAHPIVSRHRETGENILWVNFSARPQIVGLNRSESRELLLSILEQYKKPEHQVRFAWRPGSVAFWDNRATVHTAVQNYGSFPRLMERVLIVDNLPYAEI